MSSSVQRAFRHTGLKYFSVCSFSETGGQDTQGGWTAQRESRYWPECAKLTATKRSLATGSHSPQQPVLNREQLLSFTHAAQSSVMAGQASIQASREG